MTIRMFVRWKLQSRFIDSYFVIGRIEEGSFGLLAFSVFMM